jgi:hypothetical protein
MTMRALSPEEEMWNGKVVTYPAGVMAGPGCFHEAPTFMDCPEDVTVRWEFNHDPPYGHGPWSCVEIIL